MCVYMCVCVRVFLCVYVCMYIYIYSAQSCSAYRLLHTSPATPRACQHREGREGRQALGIQRPPRRARRAEAMATVKSSDPRSNGTRASRARARTHQRRAMVLGDGTLAMGWPDSVCFFGAKFSTVDGDVENVWWLKTAAVGFCSSGGVRLLVCY